MSERIAESLQTTRAALRRAAVLRGLAALVAVVVGLVMIIGCLDWLVHFDDRNTRLVFAIGVVLAGLAATFRWVALPAVTRLTDFQVAKRIEAACPELAGRLSNSVQFIDDAFDGSVELQEQTIARATDGIRDLPLEQLVDRNPLRAAGSFAAVLVVLAASLFATKPVEASTAVSRLIFPLRAIPWPRTTDLRIIGEAGVILPSEETLTVVLGDVFEVLAENTRGRLPDDSVIEHRIGTRGKSRFEPLQPVTLDTETTGETGRAILTPTKGPIYLRAVGGDHWSPWYRLDVVAPPTLQDLQIVVEPPGYLGREPEQFEADSGTLDVLVGSRFFISGASSKPLQSASIVFQDRSEPAEIDEDRKSIRCSVELDKEGIYSWSIKLADTSGIEDPQPTRYELRVVKDTEPNVFLDRPETSARATPSAVLPVRAMATDDQSVTSLRLEVVDENGTPDVVGALEEDDPEADDADSKEAAIDFEFDLSVRQAQPGQQFFLRAIATDAYDVEGETHVVTSDQRTVTIVTAESKAAELAQRQALLLDELNRIADAQSKACDSVTELRIQQRETSLLRRTDLDLLKRTELDQQRIVNLMFDDDIGLRSRLQLLADEFDYNQLQSVEARGRLDDVVGELSHIRDRISSALSAQMSMARKSAEEALTESGAVDTAVVADLDSSLENIQLLQSEVVASLQSVLAGSKAWRQQVDLLAGLTGIATGQDEVLRETNKLSSRAVAGTTEVDRRQINADSIRLAQRQERLATAFSDLLEMVPLTETNPLATQSFLLAAATSQPKAKMREAAAELRGGRPATATQLQREVATALGDLINQLSQPRPDTTARLEGIEQLRRAIKSLAEEQTLLGEKLETGTDFRQFQQVQSELRQRIERRQRQLDRQGASDAAAAAKAAAQAMRSAETELGNSNRDAAAEAINNAQGHLRRTLEEIESRQQQLKRDAVLAELQDAVAAIREIAVQQQSITTQTQDSQTRLEQTGRRTRRQARDVLNLAKQQTELAAEVEAMGGQFSDIDAISLVLTSIEQQMRVSERRLSQRLTDGETIKAQRVAARELLALAESLQRSEAGGEAGTSDSSPSEPDSNVMDSQPQLLSLASRLKLIRTLQQSIARDTREASEGSVANVEWKQLAQRQGDVSRLVEKLFGDLPASPSSDPSVHSEALRELASLMEETAAELGRKEALPGTVSRQQQVLSELDRLIKLAEAMPKPKRGLSERGDGTTTDSSKNGNQQMGNSPRRSATGTTAGSGGSGATTASPTERKRIMIQQVWGHLPPALQRRVLTAAEEKPIPKYQRLVQRYFEALAEGSLRRSKQTP